MIYLDSCALVKLVVTEDETPALTGYLDGRRSDMVSSELALTEVIRAARRSCFDPRRRRHVGQRVLDDRLAAATALLDRIDLVVLDTATLIQAGGFDDDPHAGSLDAIHLACARRIGANLAAFVTYDKTLARAATDCGLPLAQPA